MTFEKGKLYTKDFKSRLQITGSINLWPISGRMREKMAQNTKTGSDANCISVFDEKTNTMHKVDKDSATVKELLKLTNINAETVIVTRKDEVLLSEDIVSKGETISLLSVISGG